MGELHGIPLPPSYSTQGSKPDFETVDLSFVLQNSESPANTCDFLQTSKHLLSSPRIPHPSEQSQSPPPPPYTASSSSSSVPRDSKTRGSIAGSTSHRKTPSISVYPTPPASASPTRSSFHPSNPYSSAASSRRQSVLSDQSRGNLASSVRSPTEPVSRGHRRRGSSLGERFPGDMSHRPLDLIRKETKAAHRSPHLRKKAIPGVDVIDSLDSTLFGGAYHHEGPYDATLISRNLTFKNSPVAAVRDSNEEALRATPAANIRDALDKHVPLSGVAVIPPGMAGLDGKVMHYEEGADLMREPEAGGGAYKRWDHIVRFFYSTPPLTKLMNIEIPTRRSQRQGRAILFHRKEFEER